jgi:glycosyltransferase involved in cell wall biosynthesis
LTEATAQSPPSVTFVVPTLNSARYLPRCLAAIRAQDFPQDKIEVIVCDGGSSDGTPKIAKEFGANVIHNPRRTAEAGKAIAAREAQGAVIAFVDSDNVLPNPSWLRTMTVPFCDRAIISSEAIYWDSDYPGLSVIDRYCALTGVNDPLCLYLGNYGRYSYLTDRWTDLTLEVHEREGYSEVVLKPGAVLPTMGANGFLIRREVLTSALKGDFLFDIDLVYEIAKSGPVTLARVPVTIAHFYAATVSDYSRKARRRAKDYFYHQEAGDRSYPWTRFDRKDLARFCVSSALVLPTVLTAFKGYRRRRDVAWFFHPIACLVTLAVYAVEFIRNRMGFNLQLFDRTGWRQ